MWSEAATFTNPEVCQLLDKALEEVEPMAVLHGHLVGVDQHHVGHPWFHFLPSYVSCWRALPLVCEHDYVRRGGNRCQCTKNLSPLSGRVYGQVGAVYSWKLSNLEKLSIKM